MGRGTGRFRAGCFAARQEERLDEVSLYGPFLLGQRQGPLKQPVEVLPVFRELLDDDAAHRIDLRDAAVVGDQTRALFREQIEALLEGGVDCLLFETFANLDEFAEHHGGREVCGYLPWHFDFKTGYRWNPKKFYKEIRPAYGKADIKVYLRIPLSKLQFIKTSQGYLARFEILLALYKDKDLVRKTDREDSIFVETYYETHSSETAILPSFEIDNIPSGNFKLRIILKDIESKNLDPESIL